MKSITISSSDMRKYKRLNAEFYTEILPLINKFFKENKVGVPDISKLNANQVNLIYRLIKQHYKMKEHYKVLEEIRGGFK